MSSEIGILVITNIGLIGSFLYAGFRVVWWLSQKFTLIDAGIKDAKDSSIRAHRRIDKIEEA